MAIGPQLKNIILRSTKAPNLPIAPIEYRQSYLDQLTNVIRLYFTQIDNFTQATVNPLHGTTANRPVETAQLPLPIGQPYFDTTLGIPIFWDGTNWVDATGTVV